MSDPIRKPDEFPSRSESILSDTIGLEGYSIETPSRSRIEKLLIELKEIIGQGGGSSTAYATSLEITMDEYFVMSATLKNKDGDTLGQVQTVDLPLESVVVNGSYDSINKNVVLTLENGNTVSFSVADLVSGLQTEITSNNKLDADLVDDTNSTHKFTTASDISKLAGIEDHANKTVVDPSITDGGTNPVTGGSIYTALAGKLGTDTHYAGSSITGGSATSAAKLDNSKDAGSATQPVYFSSGVPTATTYSLAKTVPADAVFTDTTYESKAAASGGTDVSLVTTGDKYIWNNKQNTIDANNKLSADLVDDANTAHKFATAAQLSQITTNKNNISSIKEKTDNIMIDSNRNIYIQATAPTGTIPVGSTWISGGSLKGYVQESNVSTATIEQGTFKADGSEAPNNNRVRTTFDTDIYSMGDYTVSITGANDVLVFVYDSDKTCIQSEGSDGWKSLPYSFNLAGDRYVRFAFRKTYDAAISPSDVSNYALAFQGWK